MERKPLPKLRRRGCTTYNMRYTRRNKILELIQSHDIETQQQLAELLASSGFNVTQATVSRDIKNLMLVKQNRNGISCYAVPKDLRNSNEKLRNIMKDTVISVDHAENIIVIKTLPGCAGPASEAIDMQADKNILGTLAGENTIFVVVRSAELASETAEEIKKVLKQ